jgi:putative transposase
MPLKQIVNYMCLRIVNDNELEVLNSENGLHNMQPERTGESRPLSCAFFPMQPKRKSQRKQDYDYSQPGYYAVTVCTQNRSCLFGTIVDGDMRLNDAGRMIVKTWYEIPDHYPGIELDVMQIMPDHLHGTIVVCEVGVPLHRDGRPNLRIVNDRKTQVGLMMTSPLRRNGFTIPGNGRAQGPSPTTLSDVMERFKSITTKRYIAGVRAHGWHSFSGRLWQRSYHDRIIRNETELNRIRTYVCSNPSNWDADENNIEIQDRTCPCNETVLTSRS